MITMAYNYGLELTRKSSETSRIFVSPSRVLIGLLLINRWWSRPWGPPQIQSLSRSAPLIPTSHILSPNLHLGRDPHQHQEISLYRATTRRNLARNISWVYHTCCPESAQVPRTSSNSTPQIYVPTPGMFFPLCYASTYQSILIRSRIHSTYCRLWFRHYANSMKT